MFQEQKETVGEKPDIDEDRANPAYIPRKGMFYEHDMRLGDEGDEKQTDQTK
jgi:CASC3/Barentsz eIF4AIII binding